MSSVRHQPTLRFQLLGHIRAFLDGAAFRIVTPRKTSQLLAYLLLHRGATVSRDFLAFLFWPDDSEDAARAKLRSNLHDLIRLLPPAAAGSPWFSADGTGIRWDPESDVAVDVDEFETAIGARQLERAVAIYGGDLLEGLYDEWLLAPRERLRSAYLGALSELTSQARRRLDHPGAIVYAKRLLHADPLREDVARRLIALRYEAGDRAGALDEYARFADRLRDDLKIDPMPETVVLQEAIFRNEPLPTAERPRDGDARTPAHSTSQLPFVGRDDELNRLLDGWSRGARGRGGLAFVAGAPGIGKSRLVAELSRAVEERGGRVLVGATGVPEATPYQVFLESLRSALPLVAATRLDAVWLAVLARLLPELSHLVDDVPPLRRVAPASERARALAALAHAFVAIAQPRPLLLVLEDLHWAHDATIAALALLARRTPLAPMFIVGTYREGDTPRRHPLRQVRSEAMSAGWAIGITLRPLSVDEVAAIARSVASPLAEAPLELRTACAGNPLFLDQLLAGPTTDVSQTGELRIGTIVGAQLDRLSPPARSFAEIAALVGARFSHDIVCEVGGWDESSGANALDELLDRKIITEAGGYGEFDYAFAHQLVRDVVAESASPRRAADRHRRIARTLEALYPERETELSAELARHSDLAGDAARAARYYLLAGRRALQMSALEETQAHLRRGLELTDDPTVRADLLIEVVRLSRRTDDQAERAAALTGLDEIVELLDDDEYRRTAALLRVQFSATESDATVRLRALERLRIVAAGAGARWDAALLLEEARAARIDADLDAVAVAADAALAAARQYGDDAAVAQALVVVAEVRADRADLRGAQTLLDEAQEAAFRAGDGVVELDALRIAFKVAYEGEEVARALAIAERWLERAIALGDRYAEAFARVKVALMLFALRRDLRRALDELSKPIAIYQELGSRLGIARVHANRGILESELGDFARAAESFEQARAHFEALGDVVGQAMALTNLALVHAYAGDPQRGHTEAIAALKLVKVAQHELIGAATLENVAVTSAFCGDIDEAIRIGGEALAMLERISPQRFYPRLLGDLAMWCARRGDLATARRHVEQMLAGSMPLTTDFPQTCPWSAAQVLRAFGDAARARAELDRAYRLVATLAAELTGEERARFESVPWNREILAAHDRDEWPTLAVSPGG